MNTKISGIPCRVEVTAYQPACPARLQGRPDTWYPGEPEAIEFQVLDRRGRLAPWLAAKLDDADRARIERELSDDIKHEREIGDY